MPLCYVVEMLFTQKPTPERGWEGAVFVDGKPTSSPGFPLHPPRRHMALERSLEGRDQLLKRVKRQARDIQERHWTGLQLGAPYTCHGSCLLSLYCDARGVSYQKESGINSSHDATRRGWGTPPLGIGAAIGVGAHRVPLAATRVAGASLALSSYEAGRCCNDGPIDGANTAGGSLSRESCSLNTRAATCR